MPAREKARQFWALMGILTFLLLNYPFLQIFNHDALVAGIPILVLYLHGVWILGILGLYALSSRIAGGE